MHLPATPLRPLLLLVALGVAGCGDETTAPRVVSVEVDPASATLQQAGATQQFTARALDGDGRVVTGQPVTWSSGDAEVATVSSSGLAMAVRTGVATITASVSGVTGSALLTVLEPDPECIDPETVTIPVGAEATFGSQECFVLPAGASGDRYRVVVLRPDSAAGSDVATSALSLTAVGESAVRATPEAVRPPAAGPQVRLTDRAGVELERSLRLAASTERFHARLRRSEEEVVARLAQGARLAALPATTPRKPGGAAPALQAAPARIRLDPRTDCGLSPREEVTGILVHESAELAMYQDSTQRASSPVSQDHLRQMAEYYAAHGKAVVERYFGVPSDMDGNGRMVVFVSPVVADDEVAAFVWSGDFLERAGASCPTANGGEVIFFSNSLIGRMDDGNYQALETLVHEAKHVVSLRNRLVASLAAGGVNRFQPLWVEEGTAEIAGNMSSRAALESVGRVPVGARLTLQDLADGEGRLGATPENYGVLLRMLRTIRYLSSQPNGVASMPDGAHRDHTVYATGWNFHRWLGDAYGNAAVPRADSALFRALADSSVAAGNAGLLEVTGRTFRELLGEFARAVALHETGAPEGLRGFTSYDFVSATDILCRPGSGDGCPPGIDPQPDGAYPWPVTERATEPGATISAPLASGEFSGPIGPTGIRVHDFRSDGLTSVQVELRMDAPGTILVLRIR